MKTNSTILLKELLSIARKGNENINALKLLKHDQLNMKPHSGGWSILECLEHLNLYAAFYLPEIESTLNTAATPQQAFKSGFIGNMLVNMVKPKEQLKKMKTFKAMDPKGEVLGKDVVNIFSANHSKLIYLLQKAANNDLNKAGTAVTFTKLIKLKTGDALRFMTYHHQRHLIQAMRIINTSQ
ncbi:DinB family protein [Flavobacterium sp. Sd200]|uniref:DinB family protein n=1 Tax=Flavobacterium sp. Sd200 TaxID=2692211 RepID=UPI00137172B1|nr:DinB family protein [Flavobacterium sp. Sd200]MXN92420.1 DinB family protein [Flavobacterium sp. Sd200]